MCKQLLKLQTRISDSLFLLNFHLPDLRQLKNNGCFLDVTVTKKLQNQDWNSEVIKKRIFFSLHSWFLLPQKISNINHILSFGAATTKSNHKTLLVTFYFTANFVEKTSILSINILLVVHSILHFTKRFRILIYVLHCHLLCISELTWGWEYWL